MGPYFFQFNRYRPEYFLMEWDAADKLKNTITINHIEVDGIRTTGELPIQKFFEQINEIDNEVQTFCKDIYEHNKFSIDACLVALQWVNIADDIITLGYWGECVNIELRASCEYANEKWQLTEVHYQ